MPINLGKYVIHKIDQEKQIYLSIYSLVLGKCQSLIMRYIEPVNYTDIIRLNDFIDMLLEFNDKNISMNIPTIFDTFIARIMYKIDLINLLILLMFIRCSKENCLPTVMDEMVGYCNESKMRKKYIRILNELKEELSDEEYDKLR